MKLALTSAAIVAAFVAAAPSFATTELAILDTNTINVPPTATYGPTVSTVSTDTAIYYGFTLGTALTLSASSFTNTALPDSAFQISSMTLYRNSTSTVAGTSSTYGTTGTNLGTMAYTDGTQVNRNLVAGQYTLVLSGTATGSSKVGSSFAFTTPAVPEPATWGMMVLGFGVIGAALRTSRRKVVFA